MGSIRALAGHGVVTRTHLLSSGMTRATLQSLIDVGDVVRLDRSRYALPGTPTNIVAAVAAGGTLTCLTALEHHGVKSLPTKAVHVRRPIRRRRGRQLPDDITECMSLTSLPDHPLDSIEAALSVVLTNHTEEDAIVVFDSILNQRLRSRSELHAALKGHSNRATRLLARADARSESPLESVVRYRLQSRGIHVKSQVPIPGLGRVDLLAGRSLIIETDGYEFHAGRETFREDRRRDRVATALGFSVVRITWEQVFGDWPEVMEDISAIISSRRHRRPPRTRPDAPRPVCAMAAYVAAASV